MTPIGKNMLFGINKNPVLVKFILMLERKALPSLAVMEIGLEYVPAVMVMVWSLLNEIYLEFWRKDKVGAEFP